MEAYIVHDFVEKVLKTLAPSHIAHPSTNEVRSDFGKAERRPCWRSEFDLRSHLRGANAVSADFGKAECRRSPRLGTEALGKFQFSGVMGV